MSELWSLEALGADSVGRDAIAEVLASIPPGDTVMEGHRRFVADLVAEHDDVLDRTCRPGHLTASAMVLDADRTHALLLFHTKLQRWLQPGGHADGDGHLARVALREAVEETGIADLLIDQRPLDVDVHEVDPPKEDAHLHLDVRYVVLAPAGAAPVGNHESEALEWVPVDEVASRGVDDGLLRLLTSAHAHATAARDPAR